jgi:hypothetical protein
MIENTKEKVNTLFNNLRGLLDTPGTLKKLPNPD